MYIDFFYCFGAFDLLGFFKCTLKITLFGRSDDDANFIVVHRVTTTQSVTATDSALTNAATTILPSTVTGKSSNFFEIFYETSPKYSLEDTLHIYIETIYIFCVCRSSLDSDHDDRADGHSDPGTADGQHSG